MSRQKLLTAIVIIAWSSFVVTAYFVAQKPLALQVANHLMNLAWTFIVTLMILLNALTLGQFTIKRLISNVTQDVALLTLASGIGLGELGLLGFGLATMGASNFFLLLCAQVVLLSWAAWKGELSSSIFFIKNSLSQLRSSFSLLSRWMKWAAMLAVTLTFLMTLLPPADAFDALLYHLRMPELWLQDGGLRSYNIPHYWFPGLVEGIYFWGLGLGSEIVPQQIHFAYGLCTFLLTWSWTRQLWDDLIAGWAMMLIISMPSLLLLASWAYTDLALIFFGVAMLYTLAYGREHNNTRWWTLSAISAGMAMGVKYTSFVMPLSAILLIAIWNFQKKKELLIEITKFSLVSAVTAMIWYVRNWIWMGNPIYPFLFGGRYWDEFRSLWFATPGTGLGWDPVRILLLPLTITLGYQDINSIDADIGPLFLLLLPVGLWVVLQKKKMSVPVQITLTVTSFFTLLSTAFWVYGYITTRDLWQTRLLLPAIVPFLIPMAAGMMSLRELDTKALRLSFIVSVITAISIFSNILDMGLYVIARNPLAVATGLVTKESYLEKYQPGYTYAQLAISQTMPSANVYFLFEPRSYGMPRSVQPDPILDNFSHDVYLYGGPKSIIRAWHRAGYTHVLLNRRAADFILEKPEGRKIFDATIDSLTSISKSPDGMYELLEIPSAEP